MSPDEIASKYFYPGTRGHNILRNYYTKYRDLFVKTLHYEFDDFLNQILLNVASINFSDDIRNPEAYITGTIKIQCRVQLDKAIKEKNRAKSHLPIPEEETEYGQSSSQNLQAVTSNPHDKMETKEIFSVVNLFKLTLKSAEVEVLNSLIDEIPRKEIAEKLQVNLNTLDTQIRRLRIKFLAYLEDCGYSYGMFNRFRNN